MGHNGCDGSQASGPWAMGSGYRFTPLLRANPWGGSITPKHGSGYPGPSLKEGGGCVTSSLQADLRVRLPITTHGKTGMMLLLLVIRGIVSSIKGAGCDGQYHSGSGIHGQHRRHTTTEVLRQVKGDHKDPSG